MSRPKKLHFFGNDLHRINCVRFTTAQYLASFSAADNALRVGEASTSYLYSRTATQEIQDFSTAAKVFISLQAEYSTEVARLSAGLGRDLSHWTSDDPGADAREWV